MTKRKYVLRVGDKVKFNKDYNYITAQKYGDDEMTVTKLCNGVYCKHPTKGNVFFHSEIQLLKVHDPEFKTGDVVRIKENIGYYSARVDMEVISVSSSSFSEVDVVYCKHPLNGRCSFYSNQLIKVNPTKLNLKIGDVVEMIDQEKYNGNWKGDMTVLQVGDCYISCLNTKLGCTGLFNVRDLKKVEGETQMVKKKEYEQYFIIKGDNFDREVLYYDSVESYQEALELVEELDVEDCDDDSEVLVVQVVKKFKVSKKIVEKD